MPFFEINPPNSTNEILKFYSESAFLQLAKDQLDYVYELTHQKIRENRLGL